MFREIEPKSHVQEQPKVKIVPGKIYIQRPRPVYEPPQRPRIGSRGKVKENIFPARDEWSDETWDEDEDAASEIPSSDRPQKRVVDFISCFFTEDLPFESIKTQADIDELAARFSQEYDLGFTKQVKVKDIIQWINSVIDTSPRYLRQPIMAKIGEYGGYLDTLKDYLLKTFGHKVGELIES